MRACARAHVRMHGTHLESRGDDCIIQHGDIVPGTQPQELEHVDLSHVKQDEGEGGIRRLPSYLSENRQIYVTTVTEYLFSLRPSFKVMLNADRR